jgi:hypothetical protein
MLLTISIYTFSFTLSPCANSRLHQPNIYRQIYIYIYLSVYICRYICRYAFIPILVPIAIKLLLRFPPAKSTLRSTLLRIRIHLTPISNLHVECRATTSVPLSSGPSLLYHLYQTTHRTQNQNDLFFSRTTTDRVFTSFNSTHNHSKTHTTPQIRHSAKHNERVTSSSPETRQEPFIYTTLLAI